MAVQHTIARPFALEGVGVHNGARVRVQVSPRDADSGIVFVRTDIAGAPIRAHADAIAATANATVLRGADGASVSTVEHLLAAAFGLAIDNLLVEIDGPEMPILDGSAAPFVAALDAGGRAAQDAPRRVMRMRRAIVVADGAKSARLEPAEAGFALDVTIRYDDPAIGVQRETCDLTPETFRAEIAPARTFGRMADLDILHAKGMGLGASLENTIAVDGGRIVNPEGLRLPNEFVRHKMLDVVGDMALLGAPLIGRFVGDQCGHGLNARLVRAVLDQPDAYDWV